MLLEDTLDPPVRIESDVPDSFNILFISVSNKSFSDAEGEKSNALKSSNGAALKSTPLPNVCFTAATNFPNSVLLIAKSSTLFADLLFVNLGTVAKITLYASNCFFASSSSLNLSILL